jgi:hypothetical protein
MFANAHRAIVGRRALYGEDDKSNILSFWRASQDKTANSYVIEISI